MTARRDVMTGRARTDPGTTGRRAVTIGRDAMTDPATTGRATTDPGTTGRRAVTIGRDATTASERRLMAAPPA